MRCAWCEQEIVLNAEEPRFHFITTLRLDGARVEAAPVVGWRVGECPEPLSRRLWALSAEKRNDLSPRPLLKTNPHRLKRRDFGTA